MPEVERIQAKGTYMSWFFYVYAVILTIIVATIVVTVAVAISGCFSKCRELKDATSVLIAVSTISVPIFLVIFLISLGVRFSQIGEHVHGEGNVRNATLLVANDETCEMEYKVSQESILKSGVVEFSLKPGESRYFTAGHGDFKLLHSRKANSSDIESEYSRLVENEE